MNNLNRQTVLTSDTKPRPVSSANQNGLTSQNLITFEMGQISKHCSSPSAIAAMAYTKSKAVYLDNIERPNVARRFILYGRIAISAQSFMYRYIAK